MNKSMMDILTYKENHKMLLDLKKFYKSYMLTQLKIRSSNSKIKSKEKKQKNLKKRMGHKSLLDEQRIRRTRW